jgi:hypothetical protein
MRERILIAAGLLLFLGVFTYPVWWAAALGTRASAPELQLPQHATTCVAPVAYMRASHMQLLSSWRNDAVRQGVHKFHAADGHVYDVSLSRTCLGQCHSKTEFCDRCHAYSGVSAPSCWQCHNDPQLAARSIR